MAPRSIARSVLLAAWLAVAGMVAPARAVTSGVEGGLTVGQLSYDGADVASRPDVAWRPSWWAGISLEKALPGRLSLDGGARWVEIGEKTAYQVNVIGWTVDVRTHTVLDYVSLPLLLRWRPLPRRHGFLELGPQAGYLARADFVVTDFQLEGTGTLAHGPAGPASVTENVPTIVEIQGPPARTRYYPWNLSLVAGAGWSVPVGGRAVRLGARYAHGLTDILRDGAVRRTTRSLEFGAGWHW